MQHLLYLEEVRDELMANGCTGSSILVSLTNDASGAEDSGFESLLGHLFWNGRQGVQLHFFAVPPR